MPLPNLFEHTVKRLIKYLDIRFEKEPNAQLNLIVKYGFDGTNSSNYRQIASNEEAYRTSIFYSSLASLQLVNISTN